MLVDRDIKKLIDEGVLCDADESRIGPISYDLRNYAFYRDDESMSSVVLGPGDSVFVGAKEYVLLSDDLCARVTLKNSRIREGLSIAAPVYFPGHWTRLFFRVTNISADEITLNVNNDIAQVVFERLSSAPDKPYKGAFSNEFDFRGLGGYKDVYGSEVHKIERKAEEIESVEQRIYGNVIAIMGVFVAIFSLVNVDMAWLSQNESISTLIILNLSIVGGMSALVGLISTVLGSKGPKVLSWILALVSFGAAIALLFIYHSYGGGASALGSGAVTSATSYMLV